MRLESTLNVVKEFRNRFPWLALVVLIVFTLLILRLAQLQLFKGEHYHSLSEHNFVQERVVIPLRGNIYDAQHRPLAENIPAYNVYVTPAFIKDLDDILIKLEGYLNLSSEESLRIRHSAEKSRGLLRFREIMVDSDISRDQLAVLESHKLELAGVAVRPGPRRHYPQGELTSHVVGYVGRISDREIKQNPEYFPTDQIGKSGIELALEKPLHGSYGLQRVVVDATGRVKSNKQANLLLKGDSGSASEQGKNVVLSLDLDLQKVAAATFNAKAGAVVAIEVKTGFVKVYYSAPGFDPNQFVSGISQLEWERYRNSILDPMMDKVAQASYYPGSTYKVIPALAGLQQPEIDEHWGATCNGVKFLGKHGFHCWKRVGHGWVDLRKAIKESCDVYFYSVGETIGFEPIYQLAMDFGFGKKSGIGINNETDGVLPSEKWHRKTHKRPWSTGDTFSHVIGQGDLKVNALQLSLAYAAIANGGTLWQPQVIREVRQPDGQLLEVSQPKIKRKLSLVPEALKAVQDGLAAVPNEKGGTGYLSRLIVPQFAGKTGTAQVVRLQKDKRMQDDYLLKDHAWFVGYGPVEDPELVVAVIVEHGEHGSWAAPIVREVLAAWYEKKTGQPAERPPYSYYSPITQPPEP